MALDVSMILFIAFVIFFFIVGAAIVAIVYSRKRWPFKVVILENVSGQGFTVTGRDRARQIAFGDGGEEIFLLKKLKKYRVGYGKRIGNKQIAWAIGQDGYWYNFTFENIDKKLLEMGVSPVDRDMRFANASLRKGIENRYNDKSWMDKYGTVLYFGLFVIVVLAFGGVMWFAFDKQAEIAGASLEAIKASKEVMEAASRTLTAVDNIQGGGSGIIVQT